MSRHHPPVHISELVNSSEGIKGDLAAGDFSIQFLGYLEEICEDTQRDVADPWSLYKVGLGIKIVVHCYLYEIAGELGATGEEDLRNGIGKGFQPDAIDRSNIGANIENALRENPPPSKGLEHGLGRAIVHKKIVCANIGVLGEAMETLRYKRQRTGLWELVEHQLDDFIWWRSEVGMGWGGWYVPQRRSMWAPTTQMGWEAVDEMKVATG